MPKPKSESNEIVASKDNDRRRRRRWTAEDKKRILEQADACKERGELAALLRREGIYSQQLKTWRDQMRLKGEEGLERQKPGRKPSKDAKDRELEMLRKKARKLEKELLIAQKVIELQKKCSEVLGIALPGTEDPDEQ